MLARSAAAGLQSVGCDVVDLGIVPTPDPPSGRGREGCGVGGIGVTASHNPGEWNALKFASGEGIFLDAEVMAQFQDYLQSEEPAPGRLAGDRRRAKPILGAVDRHLRQILGLSFLDLPGSEARRFRVALDCVNGAGGAIMTELLEALGCEVVGINLEPHGRFSHDPEPTAENLSHLGDAVRASGADLGFAVDPDVDRLSLVDGDGVPLGEELDAGTRFRRGPEEGSRGGGHQPLHQSGSRRCGQELSGLRGPGAGG